MCAEFAPTLAINIVIGIKIKKAGIFKKPMLSGKFVFRKLPVIRKPSAPNNEIKKPIAGFIAGKTAPPGRTMGHAGAIVSGGSGGADAKVKVMSDCGFIMSESPSGLGEAVVKAIDEWK